MDNGTLIRRLSYSEARSSPVEAIVFMAKHNMEVVEEAAVGSADGRHAGEARAQARAATRHAVDKTA